MDAARRQKAAMRLYTVDARRRHAPTLCVPCAADRSPLASTHAPQTAPSVQTLLLLKSPVRATAAPSATSKDTRTVLYLHAGWHAPLALSLARIQSCLDGDVVVKGVVRRGCLGTTTVWTESSLSADDIPTAAGSHVARAPCSGIRSSGLPRRTLSPHPPHGGAREMRVLWIHLHGCTLRGRVGLPAARKLC